MKKKQHDGAWRRGTEDILEEKSAGQARAAELAAEVFAGISDEQEQVRLIRNYVVQNVREVDLAVGDLPLTSLTTADETLASGYGSSADRAIVMHAMLDALGLDPEFVVAARVIDLKPLINPVRKVPCPDIMDRLLVRVKAGGRRFYLNDSDQYVRLGSAARDAHAGLLVKNGRLTRVRAASESLEDLVVINTDLVLDPGGAATMKCREMYYGMPYAEFNRRISEMSPEEKDRYLQEKIAAVRQGAVLAGDHVTDTDSYPGVEMYTISIPDLAAVQDEYLYLDLPGMVEGLGGVDYDARRTPLYRDFASKRLVNLTVRVPQGYVVESMPDEKIYLKSGRSYIECRSALQPGSGEVVIQQNINLEPLFALPEDYGILKEMQDALALPANRKLVLRKISTD